MIAENIDTKTLFLFVKEAVEFARSHQWSCVNIDFIPQSKRDCMRGKFLRYYINLKNVFPVFIDFDKVEGYCLELADRIFENISSLFAETAMLINEGIIGYYSEKGLDNMLANKSGTILKPAALKTQSASQLGTFIFRCA